MRTGGQTKHFGVTFVPLGSKPRRAVRFFQNGRFEPIFVLTPRGSVATNCEIFDRELSPRTRRRIAYALVQLGVITSEQFDEIAREENAANKVQEKREAAYAINSAAEKLGIQFSARQAKAIAKAEAA